MKHRVLAFLILMLTAALFLYYWRNSNSGKHSTASLDKISQDTALASAMAKQNPATIAIIESNFAHVQPPPASPSSDTSTISHALSQPPSPLQFTNFPPAIALENVGRAVRQYGAMFGGNPVGTNPEIASQLSGKNPKHINFLKAEAGMRLNENGEMVDPWGRPYFFHQLSGYEMEIRSAGPDGKMWTPDDLVAR